MLTRIHAANFGAIGPKAVDVDLSKVTVLVGENGTGKSTILRAPSVLAQS
ncbi:MAG: AAA family ATPase, partial [bacterium]